MRGSPWVSGEEASSSLGVTEGTLQLWREVGYLKPGTHWRSSPDKQSRPWKPEVIYHLPWCREESDCTCLSGHNWKTNCPPRRFISSFKILFNIFMRSVFVYSVNNYKKQSRAKYYPINSSHSWIVSWESKRKLYKGYLRIKEKNRSYIFLLLIWRNYCLVFFYEIGSSFKN